MAIATLPSRYQRCLIAIVYAPILAAGLVLWAEPILENRFGPDILWLIEAVIFAIFALLMAVVFLLFGRSALRVKGVGTGLIDSVFRGFLLAAALFVATAVVEAFVFPGFVFDDWNPQPYVEHASRLILIGPALVWLAFRARKRMRRSLERDLARDDIWS